MVLKICVSPVIARVISSPTHCKRQTVQLVLDYRELCCWCGYSSTPRIVFFLKLPDAVKRQLEETHKTPAAEIAKDRPAQLIEYNKH
jgi:hypothetical protein